MIVFQGDSLFHGKIGTVSHTVVFPTLAPLLFKCIDAGACTCGVTTTCPQATTPCLFRIRPPQTRGCIGTHRMGHSVAANARSSLSMSLYVSSHDGLSTCRAGKAGYGTVARCSQYLLHEVGIMVSSESTKSTWLRYVCFSNQFAFISL